MLTTPTIARTSGRNPPSMDVVRKSQTNFLTGQRVSVAKPTFLPTPPSGHLGHLRGKSWLNKQWKIQPSNSACLPLKSDTKTSTGMEILRISMLFSVNATYPRQDIQNRQGGFFKDDRNFQAFFDPLPPSERKMTSLLLNTMTSLLLIVTAFGRPPLPPRLRSSLKNAPLFCRTNGGLQFE